MAFFMESPFFILGAFIIFFLASLGAILVLWIAMPFSIFGTKDLLRKMISEQEKTNKLLESLSEKIGRENIYKAQEDSSEKRDSSF